MNRLERESNTVPLSQRITKDISSDDLLEVSSKVLQIIGTDVGGMSCYHTIFEAELHIIISLLSVLKGASKLSNGKKLHDFLKWWKMSFESVNTSNG